MIGRIKTKLKRTFFLKSFTNFTIGVLGFSTTGYYITKWRTDKHFEHPLVTESIRLIGHNPQVVELAGYPLSMKITLSSQAQVSPDSCRFNFVVRGPKGQAKVELVGTSQEHGVIDQNSKQSFYIPNQDLSFEVFSHRGDDVILKATQIPKDQRFWKIDQLFVDVGVQGDFRVVLADTNKALPIQEKEIKFTQTGERKSLKDLNQEIDARKSYQPQSDQDVEEIRRYRQQEMYRRIGSVRLYMILGCLVGGMAMYNYFKKNKVYNSIQIHQRINIKSSQLHLQSLDILKRNPFIRDYFGIQPKFNNQLRGSQIGNEAEFETDIMGNQNVGVAYIKGIKDAKSNDWQISSIEVNLKNKQGHFFDKRKII